jgi:TusA-related sulfurtransferase
MKSNKGPGEHLDLRGVQCPANSARALVRLEGMSAGDELTILLDEGEPVDSVPPTLVDEGHVILSQEGKVGVWTLLVRAGG